MGFGLVEVPCAMAGLQRHGAAVWDSCHVVVEDWGSLASSDWAQDTLEGLEYDELFEEDIVDIEYGQLDSESFVVTA